MTQFWVWLNLFGIQNSLWLNLSVATVWYSSSETAKTVAPAPVHVATTMRACCTWRWRSDHEVSPVFCSYYPPNHQWKRTNSSKMILYKVLLLPVFRGQLAVFVPQIGVPRFQLCPSTSHVFSPAHFRCITCRSPKLSFSRWAATWDSAVQRTRPLRLKKPPAQPFLKLKKKLLKHQHIVLQLWSISAKKISLIL